MQIILDGIMVETSEIVARLAGNNLYLIHLACQEQILKPTFETGLALTAINNEALKVWHARLGHLGEQNI